MNQTTHSQRDDLRSEARLVRGALNRLRQDLIVDAFAFRPMLPLDDARVSGWSWVPQRLRRHLRWAPHLMLAAVAALVFLATTSVMARSGPLSFLITSAFSFLLAAPLALTLFRPIGAFWLSGGALGFAMLAYVVTGSGSVGYEIGFITHTAVMVLVVLRTRPRLAAEMWLATMAGCAVMVLLNPRAISDVAPFAVLTVFVLVPAAAIRAWREERQNVVETQTATAEERSRRTLLEERALIARELHDVVAHHMSVIAIQAEAAPYRVKDTPPELATSFSTIRENAVAALTELRRILGVVRSEDPDAFVETDPEAPQPTLASLDSLLESVRGAGLIVEAVVTGAPRPLPQGVELSAYRIVQEALSNTLRHAPGAEAQVEISYVLGGLGLRIVNGKASRLAKPSPGAGHGVLGMRERVQMLGGEMTADHTAEGGFEVAAFIPVSAAQGTAGEKTA
ncbi:sensor histidine kinase [Streptomyces sp. NPDC059788]|uniref:sensor histidine kinase n=1 Tax=Streptomyces sp. NPDC059788 TaxID=3346948 RepID=UPI00365929B4